MNEIFQASATIATVISLVAYMVGLAIKKKLKHPLFNPLLIAIILTIGFVVIFRINYENYMRSAQYLSWLLTPATIALAVPLYQELDTIKKYWKLILTSILIGSIVSMLTVLILASLFRFNHVQYVTFLPKSITTAIGMGLSSELGGIVPITVSVIIVTGIFGAMIGDVIFKFFKIDNPIAQGLALGTSAHAIGTAKAVELGKVQAAMAGLSICSAGLMTVLLINLFARIL